MIEIDGIIINKVLDIHFARDTEFKFVIYFYQDTRIKDCTEIKKLDDYNPVMCHKQDDENLGVARIVLPKETGVKFTTK